MQKKKPHKSACRVSATLLVKKKSLYCEVNHAISEPSCDILIVEQICRGTFGQLGFPIVMLNLLRQESGTLSHGNENYDQEQ